MTDKRANTRISGHGLLHEGRVHSSGYWVGGAPGIGECSCGKKSEELPTAAARRRWHKAHKAEVVEQRGSA